MAQKRKYEKPNEDASEEITSREGYRFDDFGAEDGIVEIRGSNDLHDQDVILNMSLNDMSLNYKYETDFCGDEGGSAPNVVKRAYSPEGEKKVEWFVNIDSKNADPDEGSRGHDTSKSSETDQTKAGVGVKFNLGAISQSLSTNGKTPVSDAGVTHVAGDPKSGEKKPFVSQEGDGQFVGCHDLTDRLDNSLGSPTSPDSFAKRSNKPVKPNKGQGDVDNLFKVALFGSLAFDDLIDMSFAGDGQDIHFEIGQLNVLSDQDEMKSPEVTFYFDDGSEQTPKDIKTSGETEVQDTKVADEVRGVMGSGHTASNLAGGMDGGDGIVEVLSIQAGSIATQIEAFAQHTSAGENVQLNIVELEVAGGQSRFASKNIEELKPLAELADQEGDKTQNLSEDFERSTDSGERDLEGIIDLSFGGHLVFDDFINDSFDGSGNDMSFDFEQVASLQDNHNVPDPELEFGGANVYFDVANPQISIGANIYTGEAASDDDVNVTFGKADELEFSGNEEAAGISAALGTANANIEAFTQSIVLGANIQIKLGDLTVSGGDGSSSDDDIDSLT